MTRLGSLGVFLLATYFATVGPAADVEPETTLKGHKEPIRSVAFTPDGKSVVSTAYKEIRLWDVKEGNAQTYAGFQTYEYAWGTPRLSPCGKLVAVGGMYYNQKDGSASGVRLFKIGDKIEPGGSLAITPAGVNIESDTITEVVFSPDSKVLAAVRYAADKKTHTLTLHDVETLASLNDGVLTSNSPLKIAFAPDGKTLVAADGKGTVLVFKASTGKQRAAYEVHKNAIHDVAISPDSQTLATAGEDKTVKLWDLDKGEVKKELAGHDDVVLCVTYSKDGKYLASGGKDHNVKIWDAATGKELATIEAHLNNVTCLAFSPDGTTLVTGSADKYVRLWDVAKALKAKAGNVASRWRLCNPRSKGASTMPPPTDAWPEDAPYNNRPPMKQEDNPSRIPIFTALVVLLHAFLGAGFVAGTMMIVPRFERTFRDFNLRLSDGTLFVLAMARWLNNYWYVLVPFFIVGLVVDGAILYLLNRSRRARRWGYAWAFGIVLLFLLFAGCMGGLLYEPYSTLMDSLSR